MFFYLDYILKCAVSPSSKDSCLVVEFKRILYQQDYVLLNFKENILHLVIHLLSHSFDKNLK